MIFSEDKVFYDSNSSSQSVTNPFGLYVHIPFCVHRCSYCDFYSFTRYGEADFQALTTALVREARQASVWLRKRRGHGSAITSVFFGGGTPSLLPVPHLAEIFRAIRENFDLAQDAEITLEANPETVTENFARGLKSETPVNRLSLGAQSFDPRFLSALERLGKRESIIAATRILGAAGFSNFSLDLIFGIPGQGAEDLRHDILAAAELGPCHLSFYNLTLKPVHKLFAQLPTDDEAADMYELGVQTLRELGYEQYEISNFSRPGFESRHNLVYWDGADYLGLGPSAASRFFWRGRFHHRKQLSDFKGYLGQESFEQVGFSTTTLGQTVLEAVFLELRKNRGIAVDDFKRRYGYDLTRARKFDLFFKQGLLQRNQTSLRFTDRGRLLADGLTRDLVDWSPDYEPSPADFATVEGPEWQISS